MSEDTRREAVRQAHDAIKRSIVFIDSMNVQEAFIAEEDMKIYWARWFVKKGLGYMDSLYDKYKCNEYI